MRLGIDGSNLRRGGGITHLAEILSAVDDARLETDGIRRVTVWAPDATLEQLPQRRWLQLERSRLLNGPLPTRVAWQRWVLGPLARTRCDVLFVPGGAFSGAFRPFVTMFRNVLPFARDAWRSYGFAWNTARLALLNRVQTSTFRRASGLIFLNEFARDFLLQHVEEVCGRTTVIPHGVNEVFRRPPRTPRSTAQAFVADPLRVLYVSTIDTYKHQAEVARAAVQIAAAGVPLTLHLAGHAYSPSLARLRRTLAEIDPDSHVVRYLGPVPYTRLPDLYASADAFVFASSRENMPNILLEAMAAGLPIACARKRPMTDILGDAGVYFDPESVPSIATALEGLLRDHDLRGSLAARASARSEAYSWRRCSAETFAFIASIASVAPEHRRSAQHQVAASVRSDRRLP